MTIARVLVVDDEKALRECVRRNLEARDFDVVTASNGLEALAHFHTRPTDLVILVVMMPHTAGLETPRRRRQAPPQRAPIAQRAAPPPTPDQS